LTVTIEPGTPASAILLRYGRNLTCRGLEEDLATMKLHGGITMNGTYYPAGTEVSWVLIYPFFLLHMLLFGAAGFFLAYGGYSIGVPTWILYLHGGIAILVYTIFYLAIFGRDEVKWMFINAALGVLGIVSQIDWLLSLFGKRVSDYPPEIHVIPVLYFVLYTFLIRHAVLDLTSAREDPVKQSRVEYGYIAATAFVFLLSHFLEAA
jgi:hypothetical protein